MYSSSWFLTLFTTHDALTEVHTPRVIEVFLADGWKFIFQVALAVLASLEERILASNFEEILGLIQFCAPPVAKAYPSADVLVAAAMEFKVTNSSLRQLERAFLKVEEGDNE